MAVASSEQVSLWDDSEFVGRRFTRWREKKGPEALLDAPAPQTLMDAAPQTSWVLPQFVPESEGVEADERPVEALIALQSWEGVVLAVDGDTFVVRVVDVGRDHPDEEVILSKDELSDFDLDLLEQGAVLYWTIGYRRRLGGARERVSRMRLRRLPAWSIRQLEEAQGRAEALERELAWS